ncbi:hypothetical protein C7B80_12935 [Cyanosarcina cf. burmensis CCALA 770]|nr:hypothetical protein C7B80_12935 [Cyanosarcina cf. burmensis CCALA 770]
MALVQDPDLERSASHYNTIAHLTGSFKAGAVNTPIPIDDTGQVVISWNAREPLLVAAPIASLNAQILRLGARLPDGEKIFLEFAPYTEAGAFLLVYRPEVDTTTQTALPFTISLTLEEIAADSTKISIPTAEISKYIQVCLIEGIMGRMLYLLGVEKQRLRRQGREITAMRLLPFARDNALDRIGADLGVQRFTENLIFQKADASFAPAVFGGFNFGQRRFGKGRKGDIITTPRHEPDQEYRQRLAIYRSLLVPNRQQVLELLNGLGDFAEPNRGLLSQLGFEHRFQLFGDRVETTNEFGLAIYLIASGNLSSGNDIVRNNFLKYIRAVYSIWPDDNVTANLVHSNRYLPKAKSDREAPLIGDRIEQLRSRLRQFFEFAPDSAIAPMLAVALDRLGRCRQALGITTRWRILRTQDSTGGSRYELGLGVDLPLLRETELNQMAAQLADPNRMPVDDEIEGLLKSMTARPANEDPEGHWLLVPCGIRTVHWLGGDRLYLSHLPTFGMEITPTDASSLPNLQASSQVQLEVRYHAPSDPGSNVVLVTGLATAAAEWTGSGGDAWSVLSDAESQDAWKRARRPALSIADIFRAAGLPVVDNPGAIAESLMHLPQELIETIRLPDNLSQSILTSQPTAIADLRKLVGFLYKHSLSAVLPLVIGANEIVLVVGVIGLPEVGSNLAGRRATGFRWYVVPIYPAQTDLDKLKEEDKGKVKALGSRTVFVTPSVPALSALVAVGYARRGLADPYEFHVNLPDRNAQLNLLQYEFLMNLLQHALPLGVQANTFPIRQYHVDLDGDGTADPLQGDVSRTYRQFRRSRYRGETNTSGVSS